MSDLSYELLYTPPYVSNLQPIEMIWALRKHSSPGSPTVLTPLTP